MGVLTERDRREVQQQQLQGLAEGAKDYGIRFYGIPTGYGFASLPGRG